ncbi:MAG TPA: STAS domain-containing protein [Mycobacterium sp.]|nr:STAS domain-containing protein [Mycobacterium sp.]
MTTTTTAARSDADFTVDCGGAQVRAHYRHLATVVAVRGRIDAGNVDQISDHARRFILSGEPLVLDLSGVNSFAAPGIWLLCVLDGDCLAAGVEWTLVESPAVHELLRDFDEEAKFPISASVDQALHTLAEGIDRRRQLLLPLIRKTA